MLQKHFYFFVLLSYSSIIFTHNIDKLIVLRQPSTRFTTNLPIKLKKGFLNKVTQKWQKQLSTTWNKLYKNIEQETCLQPEQLEAYLQDQTLLDTYTKFIKKEIKSYGNRIILEEDIHPNILSFIKGTVKKHCAKKNITFLLVKDLPTTTFSFGSDQHGYYLLCNTDVYTLENIQQHYQSVAQGSAIFCIEPLTNGVINVIDKSNYMTAKLVESATHLQHQSHFIAFLFSYFRLPNEKISNASIAILLKLIDFRGMLETILQSSNPLELALFYAQSNTTNKVSCELWQNIIYDISNCYHPKSLVIFQNQLNTIIAQSKQL